MNLEIKKLSAKVEGKTILNGIDLNIREGEIHALMGPNGSGKSTLANILAGHPQYEVTGGSIKLNGTELLDLPPNKRALLGLYLAFQYPVEIPGVTVGRFLRRAVEIRNSDRDHRQVSTFLKDMREAFEYLEMDQGFMNRYLNEGFSGGEKKRLEILQMLLLKPSFAILDEIDSGLDIDALKVVAKGVNKMRGNGFSALIITHYQRLLDYIKPDHVHIIYKGNIVVSGGEELVRDLERKGYDWVKEEASLNSL